MYDPLQVGRLNVSNGGRFFSGSLCLSGITASPFSCLANLYLHRDIRWRGHIHSAVLLCSAAALVDRTACTKCILANYFLVSCPASVTPRYNFFDLFEQLKGNPKMMRGFDGC